MAKKKTAVRGLKQAKTENPYHCRDCAHHYDEHSKAIDGHLILCRCPFKQEGGKYCIFLSDRACEQFKPIDNGKVEQMG